MGTTAGRILLTAGITANIKGYYFLREAIHSVIRNPELISSITKRLYPYLAKHFDTTPSKVERSMRHAIEAAWLRGTLKNINTLLDVKVYEQSYRPSNSEFIALVATILSENENTVVN